MSALYDILEKKSKISVISISLQKQIEIWLETKTPEEIKILLKNQIELVLNDDGLLDLMFYLVDIDRVDLFETLITSGETWLLYSTTDLHQCFSRAKSAAMKEFIEKSMFEIVQEIYFRV